MRTAGWLLLGVIAAGLSGCEERAKADVATPPAPVPTARIEAGRQLFDTRCVACHTVGEGDRTGPDLKNVHQRRDHAWLVRWLENPEVMGASDHVGKALAAKYGDVIMPNPKLSGEQIEEVLAFLQHASEHGGHVTPKIEPRPLSEAEFTKAQTLFFDRCAGCHGSLRAGATGPALTPDKTRAIGTAKLMATLNHGRAGGMPAWGEFGILQSGDVEILAHYLQMPPVARPALELAAAKESWNLKAPIAARPKKPERSQDPKELFAVVMRNDGMVALIDGPSKERVALLDVGFGAHDVRASASGRYLYVLNRDGRVALVDSWAKHPSIVAQVRGCFDARAIEVGARDDSAVIVGCYWPPQYAVFDGRTLEPKAVVPLDTDAPARPADRRVGSIRAFPDGSRWALSLMDPGEVVIVDARKTGFPIIARIPAVQGVIDGDLDATGRWFTMAVPARSRVAVVDLEEKKLISTLPVGAAPRLDRGARFRHPDHGWVVAVPHVAAGKLSLIGIDPQKQPSRAWSVVREVEGLPTGALSARTHADSPWIWIDTPANREPNLAREACVVKKAELTLERCWSVADRGRVLGFEFDRSGKEVWMSVSDPKGAIVVLDDATLKEVARVEGDWVSSPGRIVNVGRAATF